MSVRIKSCGHCHATGHTAFLCPRRPRKPLKTTKPMNKRGKVTDKWIQTRNKWLEVNKAPYYFCFYCNKMLTRTTLTLDHYKSRSRNPELRYVWRNLVPCCKVCNERKGSKDGDEFIKESY